MKLQVPYRLLYSIKLASRISLALIWLYEGIVPKILFVSQNEAQTALVVRSGLYYPTPELTLQLLGGAQAIVGLLLLFGWAERKLVLFASGFMAVMMVLVAANKPDMLYDPFGALVKDLCLFACAYAVWALSLLLRKQSPLAS